MTTHQAQAHELIMKFYLSEKGISKAIAKRLALISIEDSIKRLEVAFYVSDSFSVFKEIEETRIVKTEIENYKFKK